MGLPKLEDIPQIVFQLKDLDGLLVQKGQMVEEGQLIAIKDLEEYGKIQEALKEGPDDTLKAELLRRQEELEVHSKLSGRLVEVHIQVLEETVNVTLFVLS